MQPFQSGARVDIGLDMMEQRRRTINDALIVTLFQILVDQPSMTATEAMIRAQEKGALLTPVMGRQQSEALGPMIERELAILQRQGNLPPMPDVLVEAEGDFEIEYDSPLSRAQRSEQVVGISRTFEVLAPLASTQPDIFDVFDGDALAQLAAEVNGVPQKVLNTPEKCALRYHDLRNLVAENMKRLVRLEIWMVSGMAAIIGLLTKLAFWPE